MIYHKIALYIDKIASVDCPKYSIVRKGIVKSINSASLKNMFQYIKSINE